MNHGRPTPLLSANPGHSGDREPETGRRLFHLKTLFEAATELSDPADARTTLRRFLPVAMGPLGLTFGLGIMLGPDRLDVESLGLMPADRERYEGAGGWLVDRFFPDEPQAAAPPRPTLLIGTHLASDPHLPAGTSAVVAMRLDGDSSAVLVLGPKLTGGPYGEDETELLQGLADILSTALKRACADEHVHTLNASLHENNAHLTQALERMEQARDELDRQTFRLRTLFETSLELSSLNDPSAILDAFLLTLMGTFGFSRGWIGLHGPRAGQADTAYRGPDPDEIAAVSSAEGREKILARFVELKDRMPRANQAELLDDKDAVAALPARADSAVLFSLDQDWHGAIGLADPLPDQGMDPQGVQFLRSLLGIFIVTLGNAWHGRQVNELNTILSARNKELQATLDALTSAREEVTVQTEAKERIVGLVRGEVARAWRASWLDACIMILAGVVLGALFNSASPGGIELVPKSLFAPPPALIAADEARRMTEAGLAVIIDARPADFHRQEAIPGSVNLPKELFDFVYSMKLATLDPETPLLVYGRTISRHYDADVARELKLLGHGNVLVIDGGLKAWENAGYEVTR
ncbi:MAG: rhodanese-like domain-containing protein [Pseudomonadota bacterium]